MPLRILSVILSLLLFAAAPLRAADVQIAAGADAVIPYVVQVVVPNASRIAVSDVHGLVAVSLKPAPTKPAEVLLFGLDAQGAIVGAPVPAPAAPAAPAPAPAAGAPAAPAAAPAPPPPPTPLFSIKLPHPASLAAHPGYVMHMLFHPKLPLLYVWQDTGASLGFTSAKANPVMAEFDHLVVYSVSPTAAPQQVAALARGQQHYYGGSVGVMAFNADATRLYLPNLRMLDSTDNTAKGALGYYKIDDKGAVVMTVATPEQPSQPALEMEDLAPYNGYPTVMGYIPVSNDVVIFGGTYGPATWDMTNRRCRVCQFLMPVIGANTGRYIGDPVRPVIYGAGVTGGSLMRMEHVDGYITMLPQIAIVAGIQCQSFPVLLTKQNKLAFGGINRIAVVELDKEGKYTAAASAQMPVAGSIESLGYSEKFDKLYVPVEKTTP